MQENTPKKTLEEIKAEIREVLNIKIPKLEFYEICDVPEKVLPLRMWYMFKDKKCTLIDVDDKNRIVRIKNFTNHFMFKAFGNNNNPTYEDYEEFLESRCFPRTRDKMKIALELLDLPFYDPFLIIEKTKGEMGEDNFWIDIEK